MNCVFDKTETDYEQELPGGKVPLCIDCFIRISNDVTAYRRLLPEHHAQTKLALQAKTVDYSTMTLREIGSLVGVDHPQKTKHHLTQLVKRGVLDKDWRLVAPPANQPTA